jgi:hypothetical protein
MVCEHGEYLLKGEALYEVAILLFCLNLLHIADGCITPHFTIKPEHDLKLMVINGYNESQKGR